ncbi:hypothetical protein VW23_002555 [Devosia insulae DS-56]|uniref:DUF4239 domain-containing protein n=1 Tax=Devosia insulae DS-56 TaxID=1116389 RepID=A0A1E5XKG3_9HYPH|nr:hypothetical protein [Devosia insulae]OEO29093.1 hypothetical protein VW23_002555 [Devosia insulae DS-56]
MAALVDDIPIYLLLLLILLSLAAAALLGYRLRRIMGLGSANGSDGQEAYIVSAVLGLLALLMGFTLSLSLDRFETRRALVLVEANAIGTAYLRTQLLAEPHRGRLSRLIVDYLDNRLGLVGLADAELEARSTHNDQLLADLWAAAAAAFDTIRVYDFSTAYLDSINAVIDTDTSRQTARDARVPVEVFALLLLFTLAASAILGFVLVGPRRQVAAGMLLLLLALALLLMLDIDRPSLGLVKESQAPLENLRRSLAATPADHYDRWRT